MVYCSNCEKEIDGNYFYCPTCGTRLTDNNISEHPTKSVAQELFASEPKDVTVCPHCGQRNALNALTCLACGNTLQTLNDLYTNEARLIGKKEDVVTRTEYYTEERHYVLKDKWLSFFLCFFFGMFGAHKFYEGKIGMGILYIFTLGLFGIGWIIDLFAILFKTNPYRVYKKH